MVNTKHEKLGRGNSSLSHTTNRLLGLDKPQFDEIEQFTQKVDVSLKDPSDKTYRSQVIKSYRDLYEQYTSLTKEEDLISRMENKAHRRNVVFRGATTLAIGISIMFVYWLASYWGISMPLLRIPI